MTREEKVAACTVTVTDRGHDVTSPSGNTYHVRTATKLDEFGGMYFVRSCDCPARGHCVHLDAVDRHVFSDLDGMEALEDGIEVLERTTYEY